MTYGHELGEYMVIDLMKTRLMILGLMVTAAAACGMRQVSEKAANPDSGPTAVVDPALPIPCEDPSGLWGYCAADGTVIIAPAFVVAGDFLDTGIAAVATNEGWSYIDRSGGVVIRPVVFDNGPDDFSEDLARFEASGKIGFFDRTGTVIIEAGFEWARPFNGGFAAVCLGCRPESDSEHQLMIAGLWGFVDPAGEVVVPLIYEEVHDVNEGTARVKQSGQWIDIVVTKAPPH